MKFELKNIESLEDLKDKYPKEAWDIPTDEVVIQIENPGDTLKNQLEAEIEKQIITTTFLTEDSEDLKKVRFTRMWLPSYGHIVLK